MAGRFCSQCGAVVAEGRKFCSQCGKPLTQPKASSAPAAPRRVPPAEASAAQRPAPVSAAPAQHHSTTAPRRKIGLIAATAVLVIAVVCSGLWLYRRHVAAAAANTAAPAGVTVASAQKPDAGKPASGKKATLPAQGPQVAPPALQAHLETPPASAARQPYRSDANAPALLAKVPDPPRSGMLRYSGPPVPYGGVVVFRNLSGSRLHLDFDHASWLPKFSRQPDGTQTLTLRSIKHQDQTQCDVHWEVIQ